MSSLGDANERFLGVGEELGAEVRVTGNTYQFRPNRLCVGNTAVSDRIYQP